MIKALLLCIGLAILFFGADYLNLFQFLASRTFFWVAIGLFVVMIGAAFLILGVPVGGEDKDDANGN